MPLRAPLKNLLLLTTLLLPLTAVAERNIGWQTFSAHIADDSSFTVGVEYLDGRNIEALPYDGETLNAPQVQLNLRLGSRGEAYLGHTVSRTLRGDGVDGTSGGDPWFYTKIGLWEEMDSFPAPAVALIWGVLEPAANQPFGADNLAFYAFLAFSKQLLDDVRLDTNFGIGIYESDLGDQQEDEVKFNAALWYESPDAPWQAGIEYNYDEQVTGRWYDFTQRTESEYRRRRVAITGRYGETWQGFARLSAGFAEQSERWGASTGVQYGF